jgi:error-prone DNA polymerase
VCSVVREPDDALSLRLGFNYVKSLKQTTADAIVQARMSGGPFHSTDDLALRVPTLQRRELVQLARIGALNSLGDVQHRRDALWQVEQAGRPTGPLLATSTDSDITKPSPLARMMTDERLVADYAGTGLTTGPHPMLYRREALRAQNVLTARELASVSNGESVRAAGCVIARQRPGTAKGFIFISMEDETGIANVIVTPGLYEKHRIVVARSRLLLVEGQLQNQDGVIHVKARNLKALPIGALDLRSHDFH